MEDFKPEDKIVNRFEEILRHNNVSDKENAFNRLVALFICKLVDEIQKSDDDIVEFQYKVGTDTYESLQDRLQKLHAEGMEKFMGEKIFYVPDDYAEKLFAQKFNDAKRKAAIADLQQTIRILKFYSNNDFAFKDVHNEELFFQNGKILVEVVQLFQKYRIVYQSKHQFLGDLFEQLLNKGFKQNEGQFFTPTPITRFIWDCLPMEKIVRDGDNFTIPKIIDYACGAGHFLTEAVEAVNAYFEKNNNSAATINNDWCEHHIFGVEKDYRLARVARVSLYMNGAGQGKIIFGDGLEQYVEKEIINASFDILVANPPYSVSGFKAHLKLKNNSFSLLDDNLISNDGSEIETLFVERIGQLLKPKGVAAIILPYAFLSNDSNSYIVAREIILQNFLLRAIVQFDNKTFGATGTKTVVLFLEKYNEPPKKCKIIQDSVTAIISGDITNEWEDINIFHSYIHKIGVTEEQYLSFANETASQEDLKQIVYFSQYIIWFEGLTEIQTKRNSNKFKKLSEADKQKEIKDLFYKKVKEIEFDKLMYFALVYKQTTLTIIAPSDNTEQKKFLGYDWSNRKGSEGIQIISPGGLLYNDIDRYDTITLAGAIRNSFCDKQISLNEPIRNYYSYQNTQDMIDFSRTTFNKEIKLKTDKKIVIVSKYDLVNLGDIAEVLKGKSITLAQAKDGDIKVVAGGTNFAYMHNEANRPANTITISASGANAGYVNYWDEPIFASDCTTVRGKNDVHTKYLYRFLFSIQDQIYYLQKGSAQPHVYPDDLKMIQVPSIKEKLQNQIVSDCENIDTEYHNSRMSIDEFREKIVKVFEKYEVIIPNP